MIVLHLLQLYSVKSQGNAAMSTDVKSFQYSIDFYIFFTVYVQPIYWTPVSPARPPAGAPDIRGI